MLDLKSYKDLDPLARGKLFQRFKEKNNISYQQIAKEINKSPAYVVNSVRLLNLSMAIQDGLLGGLISEGHARALVTLKDQRECVEVYKEVLKRHASVREVEEMVRQINQTSNPPITKAKEKELKEKIEKILDQELEDIKVRQTRQRIQITLNKN